MFFFSADVGIDFFHMGLVATGLFDYTLEHFFEIWRKVMNSDC